MPPMVQLGAWAPDQPSVANGGLNIAFNTIPAERGYDSMPSLFTAGVGTMNSACRGALTGRSRGGTNFTVGGTLDRLYLATTGSLTNESNGGGSPYNLAAGSAGNWWSFVLYGNRIVAADYVDDTESFVVGTSTEFEPLSDHAPRAKHLAVIKDFVVAGNIIGQGDNATPIGTAENGVQWCALDDPTSWPEVGTNAAASVQSDWQPLAGNGGQVTSLVGGSDYGLVFQERAIWRMDYEGGNTFFRFTPIDENRGCWIHKAAIRVGGITYFPAEDGFMATDGMQTVPIGNELVDKFFLENFNADTQPVLSVAHFPEWKCVVWMFMDNTATNDTPNTLLLFNTQSSRWAYAQPGAAEWLVNALPFVASLDSDATSLDSGAYSAVSLDSLSGASRRTAGAFDATHGLATFTGDPESAYFETHEFEPEPGRVATVKSIRPVYDNVSATFTARAMTRMRPSDFVAPAVPTAEDLTGKAGQRLSGRYLAAGFFWSGEFKNFSGFDVDITIRGPR